MTYRELELSDRALAALDGRALRGPSYDRSALVPRIVHIGVGGFHRSHLAVYCHELAARGADWGIWGIGLMPGDAAMHDALAAQDHLYTLTSRGTDECESEVIGSIIGYALAIDDDEPAVARIAHPDTAIVSLTVTEAGYDDSANSRRTFDIIAEGLERRRSAGLGALTVLSCDNLPGNGDAARARVIEASSRIGVDFAQSVADACTIPNSMVDRITPVTSDADRAHLVERFGGVDLPASDEPIDVYLFNSLDSYQRYQKRYFPITTDRRRVFWCYSFSNHGH